MQGSYDPNDVKASLFVGSAIDVIETCTLIISTCVVSDV